MLAYKDLQFQANWEKLEYVNPHTRRPSENPYSSVTRLLVDAGHKEPHFIGYTSQDKAHLIDPSFFTENPNLIPPRVVNECKKRKTEKSTYAKM